MDAKILSPRQEAFLHELGQNRAIVDKFYLTGGTALAAIYLHHRYSEDLDFFSEDLVDSVAISVFLHTIQDRLGIVTIDFEQSYNRNQFFLHFADGEVVKTEFTYFPFTRLEAGTLYQGLTVDSLLDIAVNKLFTIYQRVAARDYVDLFAIYREQKWSIVDLAAKARLKFDWHMDPLQLGSQFLKSATAKNFPRMIKDIQPQQWQEFFAQEAEKLKTQVLNE